MPLVSVVVPIYKIEKYLRQCINSILEQTYKKFELILVDDGSPDECPMICDEYASKDDRIIVIHKKNGGLSSARNAGLDICKGTYVCFIDGDDVLKEDFLSKMINAFNEEIDFVFCKLVPFSEKIETIESFNSHIEIYTEFDFWMKHFGGGIKPSCCNKLFKSSLFDNLRFRLNVTQEDEYIIHRITSKCAKIAFLNEGLYFYRSRLDSITHTMDKNDNLRLLDIYLDRTYFYSLECKNDVLFVHWYNKCYHLLAKMLKNNKSKSLLFKKKTLKLAYKYKIQNDIVCSKREFIFFHFQRLFYFLKLYK